MTDRREDGAPPRRRGRWIVFWLVVALLAAAQWGLPRWQAYVQTLGSWEVELGPVAATDASGQLLLATVVVQERVNWSRPTRRSYANDQIVELQLNHPDASDAGRVFVLRSEETGVLNLRLLGTAPDRVWLFAEGLRAASLSRRLIEIDPPSLEARQPALRGLLSDDGRHYDLTPNGTVVLTTRDGRRLELTPADTSLAPAPTATPATQAKTMDEWHRQMAEYDRQMAEATGPRWASLPGEFGLDAWRSGTRWLGVLSEAERAKLESWWARPRQASFGNPVRRRLWIADASTPAPDAIDEGTVVLRDLRPARNDTAYLGGAILRDGFRLRAITIPDSPDVVLEHYTAVDASAELRLTRVTPEGEARWTAAVPLRFPRTVTAAGEYVALTGLPPGVDDERRTLLVSVRLADGVVGTYAYDRR